MRPEINYYDIAPIMGDISMFPNIFSESSGSVIGNFYYGFRVLGRRIPSRIPPGIHKKTA